MIENPDHYNALIDDPSFIRLDPEMRAHSYLVKDIPDVDDPNEVKRVGAGFVQIIQNVDDPDVWLVLHDSLKEDSTLGVRVATVVNIEEIVAGEEQTSYEVTFLLNGEQYTKEVAFNPTRVLSKETSKVSNNELIKMRALFEAVAKVVTGEESIHLY